jgi:Nucleotidyltransferase substrate binding protein like
VGVAGRGGLSANRGNSFEQFAPVADRYDPDLLEILRCQLWQHLSIDRVRAERRLVLGEPKTLQPISNFHVRKPPREYSYTQMTWVVQRSGCCRPPELFKLARSSDPIVRDSAIQRSEISFELCCKFLKTYLEEQHNASCTSPRTCFRSAFRHEVIDNRSVLDRFDGSTQLHRPYLQRAPGRLRIFSARRNGAPLSRRSCRHGGRTRIASASCQLVEQRLGFFEVESAEAFGVPAVDRGETLLLNSMGAGL